MLLEVVAGGEGLAADVAPMIPLVEVHAEDVSSDSGLIAERPTAPVADELSVLVRPSDVRLQAVGLVERTSAVAAAEARLWKEKFL